MYFLWESVAHKYFLIHIYEVGSQNSDMGREWKNWFPKFKNGKGMKKIIPKIREREGNEQNYSHISGREMQIIKFCLKSKMVQIGPDGPKMVPIGQHHILIIWEHFGCNFWQCLWVTKLCAKFGRSRIHRMATVPLHSFMVHVKGVSPFVWIHLLSFFSCQEHYYRHLYQMLERVPSLKLHWWRQQKKTCTLLLFYLKKTFSLFFYFSTNPHYLAMFLT